MTHFRKLSPFVFLAALTLVSLCWLGALNLDVMAAGQTAPEIHRLTPVGQMGGGVYAVTGCGDRAYVVQGLRVTVYDISQPQHPVTLGQSALVTSDIYQLTIDEEHLYGFARQGSPAQYHLIIFDISQDSPILEKDLPLPGEPKFVQEGVLYLFLDEGREIRFIDLSATDFGRELGRYRDDWQIDRATLVGRRLFLSKVSSHASPARLVSLGVADFAHPRILAVHTFTLQEGSVTDPMWSDGNRLFASLFRTILVFDVTDPHRFTEIGRIQQPPWGEMLHVTGEALYLGSPGGISTYDISDLQNPQIIQQLSVPDIDKFVFVDHRILGFGQHSWVVVEAPTPDQLSVAASITAFMTKPHDLFVKDGFAYLVDALGFYIVDVRQPEAPRLIYHYPLDSYPFDPQFDALWQVFALNRRAYLGVGNHLFIFDIADLDHVTLIKTIEAPYIIEDINALADRVYLAGYHIVAMDPGGNELVTLEGTFGRPLALQERDGHRYLYTGPTDAISLFIFDISDETSPVRLASICPRDCLIDRKDWNLDVEGNLAFLSNGSIYDVHDPAHATKISQFEPVWGRVDVVGNQAFYANDFLHWVDASQPEMVAVRGVSLSHLTRDGSWGFVQALGDVVVAVGDNGLQIFRLPSQDAPTPTPSPTLLPTATPTPLPTPPPNKDLRFVSEAGGVPWGDPTTLAAVAGNILYMAQGDAVRVMDISDPRTFQPLSILDHLPAPPVALAVQDGFVYAQAQGLLTIDVRDPEHPHITDYQAGVSGELWVTAGRIYLTSAEGWSVFDLERPEKPRFIGRTAAMSGLIAFQGNLTLVGIGNHLKVYDASDLSQWQEIGDLTFPASITIAQHAYDPPYLVLQTINEEPAYEEPRETFVFVDMTDPTDPRIVNQTHYPWVLSSSTMSDDCASAMIVGQPASPEVDSWSYTTYHHLLLHYPYLYHGYHIRGFTTDYYIYFEYDGLGVWDVSRWFSDAGQSCITPGGEGQPDRIDGEAWPLAASDTRLIAAYQDDLAIFQTEPFLRLPLEPNADRYMGWMTANRVDGWGTNLYVSTEDHVLTVDNAQPQHTRIQGPLHPAAVDARFQGSWGYLAYQNSFGIPYTVDIWALNVADPLAARYPLTEREDFVIEALITASHGLVFLKEWSAEQAYELYGKVIDARDPENPQILSFTFDFVPTDAETLTPWEPDPLVAWAWNPSPYEHLLRISRASTPEEPLAELALPYDHPIRQTALVGRSLYLLTDKDLRLIDLTDAVQPQEMARYAFAHVWGQAHTLKVVDGRAYVGIGPQVRVVDVRNPEHLTEVARYIAPSDVLDLTLHGNILTLATGRRGLTQLEDLQILPHALYLPRVRP